MSIDWEKLRAQYIKNPTMSLEDVAVEARVDVTNLKRVASEQGWYEQKKEFRKLVHQKATEKLLSEVADNEANDLIKRSKLRLKGWHLLQTNVLGVVSSLGVIDHATGLPRQLLGKELERASRIIKDSVHSLERVHAGERAELDYPKENLDSWGWNSVVGNTDWEKHLDAMTPKEVQAQLRTYDEQAREEEAYAIKSAIDDEQKKEYNKVK